MYDDFMIAIFALALLWSCSLLVIIVWEFIVTIHGAITEGKLLVRLNNGLGRQKNEKIRQKTCTDTRSV